MVKLNLAAVGPRAAARADAPSISCRPVGQGAGETANQVRGAGGRNGMTEFISGALCAAKSDRIVSVPIAP
jgi:hypothetical protein